MHHTPLLRNNDDRVLDCVLQRVGSHGGAERVLLLSNDQALRYIVPECVCACACGARARACVRACACVLLLSIDQALDCGSGGEDVVRCFRPQLQA